MAKSPKSGALISERSPLSNDETQFLEDLKGFVDYGLRNGVTFLSIMATITHDVNEISRYGFDFEAAKKRAFRPKVSGYANIDAESIQGVDEES